MKRRLTSCDLIGCIPRGGGNRPAPHVVQRAHGDHDALVLVAEVDGALQVPRGGGRRGPSRRGCVRHRGESASGSRGTAVALFPRDFGFEAPYISMLTPNRSKARSVAGQWLDPSSSSITSGTRRGRGYASRDLPCGLVIIPCLHGSIFPDTRVDPRWTCAQAPTIRTCTTKHVKRH